MHGAKWQDMAKVMHFARVMPSPDKNCACGRDVDNHSHTDDPKSVECIVCIDTMAGVEQGGTNLVWTKRSMEVRKTFLKPLNLWVKAIHSPEQWIIFFDAPDRRTSIAYNLACEDVMKTANLSPFHQVGSVPDRHSPGIHGWEIWNKATKEFMESLFPKIHDKAGDHFAIWSQWPDEDMLF